MTDARRSSAIKRGRSRSRGWAIALTAVIATGCGGGSGAEALIASGFTGPAGASFAGHDPALSPSGDGQGIGLPAWRQTVSAGTPLSVSLVLSNRGSQPVTITGLGPRDAVRDGLWIPDRILGAPVALAPGAAARVTLTGHASGCGNHTRGQSVPYGSAVIEYRENGGPQSQQVEFDGALELTPASCPG